MQLRLNEHITEQVIAKYPLDINIIPSEKLDLRVTKCASCQYSAHAFYHEMFKNKKKNTKLFWLPGTRISTEKSPRRCLPLHLLQKTFGSPIKVSTSFAFMMDNLLYFSNKGEFKV